MPPRPLPGDPTPRDAAPGCLHHALFVVLCWTAMAMAQEPVPGMADEELQAAERQIAAILAGPRQPAFGQVLTQVRVLRDRRVDSLAVYDISVHFDPVRYRAPHSGIYPLSFEDQFIQWGKRIALYTRVSPWRSGRFLLHDQHSGRQAWIPTETARQLYPGPTALPFPDDASKPAWQRPYHDVPAYTPMRQMGLWIRALREDPLQLLDPAP